MASFPSYSLAKGHADELVKDLAKGSQVTALQPAQARDALAAMERLETLRQSSGRRFSLLAAVSDFAEAVEKLRGRAIGEAVDGYLRTVVSIQRKDNRKPRKARKPRLSARRQAMPRWLSSPSK
jgi:hypothetical protein